MDRTAWTYIGRELGKTARPNNTFETIRELEDTNFQEILNPSPLDDLAAPKP
jgi:hypothetical protein